MFNREIHLHFGSIFQPAMLVYRSVKYTIPMDSLRVPMDTLFFATSGSTEIQVTGVVVVVV